MPDPIGIQPFQQFLDLVPQAKPEHFVNTPDSRVTHAGAFEQMKAHVLHRYAGVESQHSFEDANGSVFDCVPIEQQPGRRGSHAPLPKAPDLPRHSEPGATASPRSRLVPPLRPERLDRHGNSMFAPDGTIPIRRLTLENLARFESLRQFLQKSPFGSGRPPRASERMRAATATSNLGSIGLDLSGADLRGADLRRTNLSGVNLSGADLRGADLREAILGSAESGAALVTPPGVDLSQHLWAHAAQSVANGGGHSFLSIFDPPIGPNQVFSLCQHWYIAGSGEGLQTVEAGWQVFPQHYRGTNPVLFVYWTADNYNNTGSYNLDQPSMFVQTSSSWMIGGALSSGTPGGEQQEIELAYHLSEGNWWLYVGGENSGHHIGYYPASQYGTGPLASGQASEIDYGGEVVGSGSWPPMGSGGFAEAGWQHAAYQRDIHYYPPGGGIAIPDLIGATSAPRWYSVVVSRRPPPWNETIFLGGPGGSGAIPSS
jgi:hypothetical protein